MKDRRSDLRREEINLERFMDKNAVKENAKGALAVVVGVSLVLVPYSFLIGWNAATLLLFWFVIVPWIALYIPGRISRNKNHLIESLAGLVIFYALVVLMIFRHYKSDYFLVMMVSCAGNFITVSVIRLTKKKDVQTSLN